MAIAVMIYYILMNIIALVLYGTDKKKAEKHKYRIPEKTLFAFSLMGGALGALAGMEIFHHKTRKKAFWAVNLTALILHVVLLYFLLFRIAV